MPSFTIGRDGSSISLRDVRLIFRLLLVFFLFRGGTVSVSVVFVVTVPLLILKPLVITLVVVGKVLLVVIQSSSRSPRSSIEDAAVDAVVCTDFVVEGAIVAC